MYNSLCRNLRNDRNVEGGAKRQNIDVALVVASAWSLFTAVEIDTRFKTIDVG